MLSRIFDTDNAVFRVFRTVGYIWWLHVLWLVCSLPIITIGASTTALCYSCMKLRNREGYVTGNFFRSFKENFVQSTMLFLFFIITGGLLILNLILGNQIETVAGRVARFGALVLLIPYCMTLLYAFAIQAKFVNPVRKTLRYAFGVALKYYGYTFQMVLIVAGVLILNLTTIVLTNFVTLTIGVGVMVYVLSIYYNKIFSKILMKADAVSGQCPEMNFEN